MADRVQLQQALMNLMLNGIEAMRNTAGEMSIKSRLAEEHQVRISITDAGMGLPIGKADQIFNAFFTTKPQGTDLGLAITRTIVESQGGHIWAVTNLGRVQRFTLRSLVQSRLPHKLSRRQKPGRVALHFGFPLEIESAIARFY